MKKLSDAVDNEVVKNRKFKTPKTKVNTLEKKIPDATTLIYINQYNTGKQNFEKKNWKKMLIKNTTYKWSSECNQLEYKN